MKLKKLKNNYKNKIKNISYLKKIIKLYKKKGKKIVFTNGCFDILHLGHIKYLNEAKKLGDILIVGVNSDESVKKIKGEKRPIMKEEERSQLIAALNCVDYVIIFNETTPFNIINILLPDILVKGGDYKAKEVVGEDVVTKSGGKVVILPFYNNYSSSKIIEKIIKKYAEN